MAARRPAALTKTKERTRSDVSSKRRPPPARPLVYTAQDVARFCEVDLKTIHHWADGGKIAHHRTSGRHLRFRRNHVLAFLRRHGYPVHAEIAHARPTVFLAASPREGAPALDEVAKKLGARFFVRRFASALEAIAHLVAGEPDVLVFAAGDPTLNGAGAVRALKAGAETAWPVLVVIVDRADEGVAAEMKDAGADMVVGSADAARLGVELARALAVE